MTLPKPERVRAFKPKTKTGCLTCKKRRVKCDEARPECNRCSKLGIECGYKIERSATHGSRDHPRLLPKHVAPTHRLPLQAQAQAQAWAWTVVRSPGEPPSAIFRSQPDYAYFCFFREQSTRILAGPYRDNLWERIVLQACHEEPSIRALAASIGALDLSTRGSNSDGGSTTSRGSIPSNPLPPVTGHRVYALDQYGRALAAVRKLADSDTPHPGATRLALIAAILIYCFECIYDGPETAVAHFEKALYFLGMELARYGRPYIHLTTSSPTPDLEGELVAAFVRLDSGLLGRPASYQSVRLQRLLVTCDFSDLTLPPAFSSLNEARNHLEQAEFHCIPQVVNSWADAMTPEGLELSEETLAVARETSTRIAQWMAAFAPILARAHESRACGGPFTGEYSLQIHALLCNLAAQAVWARAEDAHEHEALARDLNADSYAINAFARAIADEPDFKKTFVWDNCILQGLITVIVAAPDRAARTQALDLINSIKPRREGAWDSDALSKTGEVVLGMSEDLNPFGKVHLNRFYVFTGVRNVGGEEQQKPVERAVPTERSPDEWDPEVNSTGNPKVMGFGQVLADWACRI